MAGNFPGYTPEQLRKIQVRIRAKIFARAVRESNWAMSPPDSDTEWLQDSDYEYYREVLKEYGLVQRTSDLKWEWRQS